MNAPHPIGSIVWHRGNPCLITSAPYTLHGGEFQDAVDQETGKSVVVATPAHVERRSAENISGWHDMQRGFQELSK